MGVYSKGAPNPHVTQSELSIAAVLRLFNDGMDTADIAIRLNHPESAVYNIIARLGRT